LKTITKDPNKLGHQKKQKPISEKKEGMRSRGRWGSKKK